MRIYVKVTPRARRNEISEISEGEYRAKVMPPPEKGKANAAVIQLLADHFHVARNRVNIVAGKTAKIKIIDINI